MTILSSILKQKDRVKTYLNFENDDFCTSLVGADPPPL